MSASHVSEAGRTAFAQADPDPRVAARPVLSIIAPHLNQPDYLAAFLHSLYSQFDMSRVEVIVVDNGSRESPAAVVAPWPQVILGAESELGPGPARNQGVTLSHAPIMAFTDADVLFDPDWMARLLKRFEDPATKIIGGEVRVFPLDPENPTPAEAYEQVYAFPQRKYIEEQGFSVAANLAMRREVFDAVGPFVGISVAEDTEWGQRATKAGFRTIYTPEVLVHHPARPTMDALKRKWDRNISHHYEAHAQGAAGKVKWLVKAGALLVSPLVNIPRLLTTPRLKTSRDRWRAFRALAELRAYRARKMLSILIRARTRQANMRWNRD